MTEQEKIAAIAEKVMGLHKEKSSYNRVYWCDSKGNRICRADGEDAFDPYKSGADCFMVLEAWMKKGERLSVLFEDNGCDSKEAICDSILNRAGGGHDSPEDIKRIRRAVP